MPITKPSALKSLQRGNRKNLQEIEKNKEGNEVTD